MSEAARPRPGTAPPQPQSRAHTLFGIGSGNAMEWFDWGVYTTFTPFFASQFFHNMGSQYAGLLLALVATLLTFIPFILFKFGPALRARSRLASATVNGSD